MTMGEMLALFVMTTLLSSVSAVDIDPSVLGYLTQYNYLNQNSIITQEAYAGAIKKLQRDFGLKVSGELNGETKAMMTKPRCGVVDNQDDINNVGRRKRYVLLPTKWPGVSPTITYFFNKPPSSIAVRTFYKQEMRIAFKMWSDVANINFRESNNKSAIIIINFVNDDLAPAWALAPGTDDISGDIFFSNNIMWTNHSYAGPHYHFRTVATHEIGHAIGLNHSPVQPSVMKATFGQSNFSQDDIAGAVALYGPRIGSPPPTLLNKEGTKSYLCSLTSNKVDAIVTVGRGRTYALKGSYAYTMGRDIGSFRLPKELWNPDAAVSLGSYWLNVPCNVKSRSCSWTYFPEAIYIFKNSNVYKIELINFKEGMTAGDAEPIDSVFPGLGNDKIDAAYVTLSWYSTAYSSVYILRGDKLYRTGPGLNTYTDTYMDNYKASLGIDFEVRAAFQYKHYDGQTFFFDNNDGWYTYNHYSKKWVDPLIPDSYYSHPYPRSIKDTFFRCPNNGIDPLDAVIWT